MSTKTYAVTFESDFPHIDDLIKQLNERASAVGLPVSNIQLVPDTQAPAGVTEHAVLVVLNTSAPVTTDDLIAAVRRDAFNMAPVVVKPAVKAYASEVSAAPTAS